MPKNDRTQTLGPNIAERLEHGVVTIAELCVLGKVGKTSVYQDIRDGTLPILKHGRSTRIAGPVAKAYITGQHRRNNAEAA